jgi:hypothetical protein
MWSRRQTITKLSASQSPPLGAVKSLPGVAPIPSRPRCRARGPDSGKARPVARTLPNTQPRERLLAPMPASPRPARTADGRPATPDSPPDGLYPGYAVNEKRHPRFRQKKLTSEFLFHSGDFSETNGEGVAWARRIVSEFRLRLPSLRPFAYATRHL